jgi:hypothetical protein
MLKKIISNVIAIAVLLFGLGVIVGIGLFVYGIISAFIDDSKDYPGKKEFLVADNKVGIFSGTATFGDSPEALAFANDFSKEMGEMQSAFFTGGSHLNAATAGHFLTFCRITPSQVIVLCHVPDMRGYKDDALEALNKLAWLTAQTEAKTQNVDKNASLVVGLRGFASYGSVWEGKVVGAPTAKGDGPFEVKRIYPYFIPSGEGH